MMPQDERHRAEVGSMSDALEVVWPGYLRGGYFGADHLRPEYVGRENVSKLAQSMASGAKPLTTNQLRRFFGHARAIEARLLAKTANWEQVEADFKKLDIAAADAFHKSDQKIPRLFHDFIKCNVAAVSDKRDFLEGFMPHFEALVGFGTEFFRSDRR